MVVVSTEKEMPFVGTLPQIFLSSEYLHYFVSVAEKVCRTQEIFSFWSCRYRGKKCCHLFTGTFSLTKARLNGPFIKSTSAKKKNVFQDYVGEAVWTFGCEGLALVKFGKKRKHMLNLCILPPHLFMLL